MTAGGLLYYSSILDESGCEKLPLIIKAAAIIMQHRNN